MDLNELQSVQSRERQTDSLQQLRATFYRDAADYIADLESERDAAAERADDPWNAPEVGRLNHDIDTAKDTVEVTGPGPVELRGERFDLEEGTVEVPEFVGVFLMARGRAEKAPE